LRYTTIYNDPITRSSVTEAWIYWDDLFTTDELKKITEYCESIELIPSIVHGGEDRETTEKIRISDVNFHYRSNETAWIFDRFNELIQTVNEQYYGFELNGYDRIQYAEYDGKRLGNYDWHVDMALGHASEYAPDMRKLSLSLLLNDDFEGGEFQIASSKGTLNEDLPMRKGRTILFPSFMMHRVKPVTKGKRKSLVIWVLGPKFI